MCFEEELSDEEYSDSTGVFQRQAASGTAAVTAASSLEVDPDGGEGANGFSHSEDGFTRKSEPQGSESPLMRDHSTFSQKAAVGSNALSISGGSHTNQDEGQLESKRSPKLEHKAVVRVKSMMSIEAANLPPQQSCRAEESSAAPAHCGKSPRMAAGMEASQHSKKGGASEADATWTHETVILQRTEGESFGLDLEIMSSPLKVVITGLKAGGAAEKVLDLLISSPVSVTGYCIICAKPLFKKLFA